MQHIARAFLSRATAADEVSVVRLDDRSNELSGDRSQALIDHCGIPRAASCRSRAATRIRTS